MVHNKIADLSFNVKEAYLFGKGPSLKTTKLDDNITLRVCINDSYLHVDKPSYVFTGDHYILTIIRKAKLPLICVRPVAKLADGFTDIYTFEVMSEPQDNDHTLWVSGGSATAAIDLMGKKGIKKIHLVGFDAFNGIKDYAVGVYHRQDCFKAGILKSTCDQMARIAQHHGIQLLIQGEPIHQKWGSFPPFRMP